MKKSPTLLRGLVHAVAFVAALAGARNAAADIAAGVDWLKAREGAAGVHRASDLANAADTNAEAYITLAALSRSADFPQLSALVQNERDETLLSLARLARNRIALGQSGATQLDAVLVQQQTDGGIPPVARAQGEPLTTAVALGALDRAGRAGGTEASRALGYLLAQQQTDGGWLSAAGNRSSVFATAQVARVLADYRNRYDLTAPIGRATAFLVNARSNNYYGSAFETGFALDTLVVLRADRASLAPVAAALAAAQAADGSFDGDAYVTAIALRALWQYEQPVIDPQAAALTGRVLAADTDLPINGATLTLTGAAPATLVTNDLGRLQSSTLTAGSYSASLAFAGMRTVEFQMTLANARTLDLGDIRMYRDTSPSGDFALIRGVVTSARDGAPIAGASVRLETPPNQSTTGGDGRYQFLQVPPGNVRIVASAAGHAPKSAQVDVQANQIIDFSPVLEPVDQPIDGTTIRGTVRHGRTNQPLAGVTVAVVAGAPPVSTQTDAAGNYTLQSDASSLATITASLATFDSVTISAPLIEDEVLPFSPRLYPQGDTPPGANATSIEGIVVNQANRQPIPGAQVIASDPGGQRTVTSGSDGKFKVNVSGPVTRLAFSADAFEPATLAVPVQPLEARDIGQVGLKPTTLQFYFPDLAITSSTLSTTDPDSFALDASFTLEVTNRGTSTTTQDFTVVAFVDANGNGAFDAGAEPEVGRTRVDKDLAIAGTAEVHVAVDAQLTFRDAPVAFLADAENEIPEQVENNNVASSLIGCRVRPSFVNQGNVYEYWRWSGLASNPQINSLNQTPAVAQLTDDNGDGAINEYDTPDVIFVAGLRNQSAPSQTALVALDGKTGHELWSRTDFRLSHFSSPAVGDLDNDGVAEIVVVTGYRTELIAFENNGTLKWRRPLTGPGIPVPIFPPPPYVYDAPIIVNLEGDNEGEVVLGRAAYRGLTGEKLWEGEFDAGSEGGKPRNAPLAKAGGIASIAADVDLDGRMEIIAGRTMYDFEGRTIWHLDDDDLYFPGEDAVHTPLAESGYVAVGNFDLDDYAEIVLVINKKITLVEHDGTRTWTTESPDGMEMGAPTIADIDHDGLPEIIVSSRGDAGDQPTDREGRLTVFESDGTVKKTFDIDDRNGMTSATVFDLQNDGIMELMHADQFNFRILDAQTLVPLFETANSSRTVYENPVVADVDGDKQAEIIITGYDDDLTLPTPGIRVFKARNGAWADAGSVWGSHAFHVDDINEDSTLPLLETPSWLTHNTYRVQRSPQPDPLGMPDFSVGDLRLVDQGPGRNPVVQVRVGNAGPVDAHEPPWIGVYRGDPAAGGVLLKETRLDTLRAARFQIVNLGEVPTTGSGDLYAVVDQRARATECREINNQRHIPFTATNGRGDLQLSTDRISYRPGDVVTLIATVANQGALAADYTVTWQIRDAQGREAAPLADLAFGAVPAAQSAVRNVPWPSDGVLAATYTLVGQLRNEQGSLIDTATATFVIAGDVTGPGGALRLTTPRAAYAPGEPVALDYRAQNLSSSEQIRLPEVVVTITGPAAFNQQRAIALDDLFPGAFVDGQLGVDGADAPGVYTATARLRSRLTGADYATATATFERLADTSANVQGFVDVSLASLLPGQPQTCLFTVRNRGTESLVAMPLRKRAVALDSGAVVFAQEFTSDLAPGADYVASETLATTDYVPGEHACLIEARQANGEWRILDAEPFVVRAPAAPGIVVTPTSGLVTTEAGQSATFTLTLASRPTADVVVPLAVSDATELRLPLVSVTITPSTWDVPRTVTVIGVDDTDVDGDVTAQVLVGAAQSADAGYAGLDGVDVEAVNRDDDGVRIDVSPTSLATSENGTSATFAVQINAAPSAPVMIALTNPDTTEWQVAPASLVFDANNWQSAQSVTVTGVDDGVFDGTQTGTLALAPAQSADPRYAGVDPADVSLANADNEQAAIVVDPTAVLTNESGQAGAFAVRLNREPAGAVTIPVGPVDASEWQVLATQIVLDATNWSSGQTVAVTPVDDADVDGDQTATLVLGPAQSADAQFAGLDPADVALTNLDDDSARILVVPTSGLVVDENGATATFTVALTTAPTSAVTIDVTSGDATEFAVAPVQLTFTPQDWATRTVTVTGVDDAEVDGNIVGAIALAPAVSSDTRYGGIDPPNVAATNIDNETIQIVVTPDGSIETDEGGAQATVDVRLSTAPTQDVTIALTNPDASEFAFDRASLVFPAGSTAPQRLTVSGVDDFDLDGDITGVVALAPAASQDARFNGLDPRDVPALNRDDDLPAAVTVTPASVETRESGTSATFEVRLSTAPSADVAIVLVNPDATEFALDRSEVRFTAADWQTPQTVTATGVDDVDVDGDVSGTIALAPIVSQDARYAGLDPADVAAVNRDDDAFAQVSVSPAGPVETTEAGNSVAISVQVSTQPTADVVIALTNPDATEFALDRAEVRITPADWQSPHGFVVTGVDDADIDGDIAGTIVLAPIVSTDGRFNGVDPADVPAVNRDNDVPAAAAMLVTADDLDVSESGDGGRLRVALNRAPSADVRIAVVSADPNEVTVAPFELTFTPANATVPQIVALAGVDEHVADGDRPVNIAIRIVSSADPAFAALPAQNVVATNRDDDAASFALALEGPAEIVEGAATDLRLTFGSQPLAPLTVTFTASVAAPGQPGDVDFALQPQTIVVQPAQWQTGVPLRLSTVDNRRVVGDRTLDVRVLSIAGADPAYAALIGNTVPVRVRERGTGAVAVPVPALRAPVIALLALGLVLLGAGLKRRAVRA